MGKQCLDFPIQLPDFSFFISPPLVPPVPLPATLDFCCRFKADIPEVNQAIQAANALIATAFTAGAVAAMTAFMTVNTAIAIAQYAIDYARSQIPECPLDDSQTSLST